MTTLTAIVPATNAPPTLARCVAAIRAAVDPPEQVIVVSEGASKGPAAARNDGAAQANGDILVFVDADVVPDEDAFRRIRTGFDDDPDLTALFGSYDDAPEAPGVVSGFRNLLHHHVHHGSPGLATTFWAGLGAIRREAFLAAGGFDAQRYPRPSIEDIELGVRLADAGARIRLDPEIQGRHLKSWSLGEMLSTDFGRRGVPWVVLLARNGTSSSALNLGWRHRLSAGASLIVVGAVVGRRPRLAFGALAALIGLNASFYVLLARRRGLRQASVGVPLHVLHHVAGACAIPVGLVAALAQRR